MQIYLLLPGQSPSDLGRIKYVLAFAIFTNTVIYLQIIQIIVTYIKICGLVFTEEIISVYLAIADWSPLYSYSK